MGNFLLSRFENLLKFFKRSMDNHLDIVFGKLSCLAASATL